MNNNFKMKKSIFYLSIILLGTIVSAQVSIGKKVVNTTNTILEFDDAFSNTKGLILPTIDVLPSKLTDGTFLYDKGDQKLKVFENSMWKYLSDQGSNATVVTNISEDIGEGVIIGAENSNATGVLVLESDSKAMILPKISKPEENVPNPYPGMICYDLASKSLAAYDGKNWNYWK